mmetsp:Transcript_25907/g.87093  ORF Transcript_25907/g.87093 Transcript_25907/m.87093 type:complete len:206 (+) Transcript_25907:121-738(+)
MFTKAPTAKEAAKAVQRQGKSSQRELDRELRDLDTRETKLIAEIKKEAGLGRSEKAVHMLAKQLVQLRAQRDRLVSARAHLGAIANHATAMAANAAVFGAVATASKSLGAMNKAMDVHKVGLTMAQFQKETERMNMSEDLMDDMLGDAFDTDDVETDAIVGQVLAQVGVDLTAGMRDAPSKRPTQQSETVEDAAEEKMRSQIDAL